MALKSDVFMWNEQLERMPRAELERLQLHRLQNTVEHVLARVPFYQKRLAERHIDEMSINSLADVQLLPFTTKSDLRDQYPFGLLAVEQSDVKRIHVSSGTRGKPTVACYTTRDLETWSDLCARSLAAADTIPGDVVQNSYGYGLFTGGLGLHYGAERLGATVVPSSAGRTQQQVLLLQDFGARVLCSTPSYALNIAFSLAEMNVALQSLRLRIGIFGAEPWTDACRRHIEERLQIKAYDIYGLSEIMGPGVAMECTAQSGLHIWEDHFFAEVIDPITLEPAEEGKLGELVITTLTKEGMPLLRYRTGDACKFVSEPCACGRTMRRISRIQGRLDDMLIIRGVNLYPSEVEAVLYNIPQLAPQYQILIKRERALDELTVRVEVDEHIQQGWRKEHNEPSAKRELELQVHELLKERLGLNATVEVLESHSLPRSEGKALRVLDLRAAD